MQGAVTQQINVVQWSTYNRPPVLSAGLARRVVEHAVATTFQVPLRELRARTRRRAPIAFARQVAMYLAHVAYGLTLTEVGILFTRDRTTVAHACGIVEDRRDDPVFDIFLDHLETSIVRLANALNTLES
jgi:hypothetical protein